MSTPTPKDASLAIYQTTPQARLIPHLSFGCFPTPVERLETLGEELGIGSLWVKRDDDSGTEYGGNKVRKLEFLLADALARDFKEVWTVGAIGSHHALATAIYAHKVGLGVKILHYPQPLTDHVRENLRALSTARPKLTLVQNRFQLVVEFAKFKLRRWLSRNKRFYYIPGGGSSARGVLGYINAAFELKKQVDQGELPAPDYIFVAAGTCGTLAGLVLGAKMARLDAQVVGVRVVDKIVTNAFLTARLANQSGALLTRAGVSGVPSIRIKDVIILDGYFGPEYGAPTKIGQRALRVCAECEQLILEPTYTGKAFSAIIGERERLDLEGKNVLYWHTLNSVDLSPRVARADVARDLPAAYQKFFAGEHDSLST